MKRMILGVNSVICAECSLALKRFIGSIKGVRAVVVVSRDIIIGFDSAETTKDEIAGIAKNCVEKLGYTLVSIE